MIMDEPVRVVHVLGALHRGGAETFVMNVYRHIDRTRIQFDFIIHTNKNCSYRNEIEKMGGRIYIVRQFSFKNMVLYIKTMEGVISRTSGMACCPWACKKYSMYLYAYCQKSRKNSYSP